MNLHISCICGQFVLSGIDTQALSAAACCIILYHIMAVLCAVLPHAVLSHALLTILQDVRQMLLVVRATCWLRGGMLMNTLSLAG